MKYLEITTLFITTSLFAIITSNAAIDITGVNSPLDAFYGSDVSNSDLINSGSPSLSNVTYSQAPWFGPNAHNDGSVGIVNNTSTITWWRGATAGSTYSITYELDTSSNTLGYDINSIQTINGWTNNSGNQKNQNYVVEISVIGSAAFNPLASVAYLPFGSGTNTASTKVNITEDTTGILASGVDEIRFTYTVPASAGQNPSPTIREIDVIGTATAVPEPSSAALIGISIIGSLLRRNKK